MISRERYGEKILLRFTELKFVLQKMHNYFKIIFCNKILVH